MRTIGIASYGCSVCLSWSHPRDTAPCLSMAAACSAQQRATMHDSARETANRDKTRPRIHGTV
ncbi:hypothetical protein ACP93_03735 [Xanthomonas sp. NCPPB 1128]|nr:hypothetical protein ACP93_03735 [Xanthomonas sp. NCPPB 1128]